MSEYAPYLIGLGVAALAFWWMNRKPKVDPFAPVPDPNDVTPARRNKFELVATTWYTVEGLAEHSVFRDNSEAQAALKTLKGIIVQELEK